MDSGFLTTELRMLLEEVAELREETKGIACKCGNPDCPFNSKTEFEKDFFEEEDEKQSPDLGFGSMEAIDDSYKRKRGNRHSLPLPLKLALPPMPSKQRVDLSRNSTSLTNIPRGMQKRADGTILEFDYPGARRERKNGLGSGFSMSHLNRLGVYVNEKEDCQVDQDGLLTNNDDYMFSRKAPERQILRNGKSNSKKDSNGAKKDLNVSRMDSSHSTSSLLHRRTSDGLIGLSMARHSSADVVMRHSGSTTAIDSSDRLANFVRLKNFQMKRRSVLSS